MKTIDEKYKEAKYKRELEEKRKRNALEVIRNLKSFKTDEKTQKLAKELEDELRIIDSNKAEAQKSQDEYDWKIQNRKNRGANSINRMIGMGKAEEMKDKRDKDYEEYKKNKKK